MLETRLVVVTMVTDQPNTIARINALLSLCEPISMGVRRNSLVSAFAIGDVSVRDAGALMRLHGRAEVVGLHLPCVQDSVFPAPLREEAR